jgi:hypothetical protein
MPTLMRFPLFFTVALLFAALQPRGVAAQTLGPEGTPQIDASTEKLSYTDAAVPHMLTQYEFVFSELDHLADDPSAEDTKSSELRKRLLDLRLLMDLYAFAFDEQDYNFHRDIVDEAYERTGEYKDLFDAQSIDKQPINEEFAAVRLDAMKQALAPLRSGGYRDELRAFFHQHFDRPHHLRPDEKPTIWAIAMAEPNTRDDAAGNVAMIGNFILRNLADQGMTVDDILDPNQEAQFHAVRKAVRSVEVLVDMFPSLTAAVGEAREPLDDLVGDFGKVNDQIIALRLEEAQSWDTSERVDALRKAYAKAVKTAQQFVSSDELDNYARPLELAERRHRLK